MSLARTLLMLATVVPACPDASTPSPSEEQPPTSARRGDGRGPVESVERTATIMMPGHFADLLEVHSALIRGSVADARVAAASIVDERPSVMLESWAPYLYATHDAALAVSKASDLKTAAVSAAELARTCGSCHSAQAANLSRTTSVAPSTDDGDDKATMRRHAWAFGRLWEALVLPSDEAWKAGVEAFVELPECAADLSGEQDRDAIRRARDTVRASEKAARAATTWEARAEIYGTLLPTCASCHASGC